MTNRIKSIQNIVRRHEKADYYQTRFPKEIELSFSRIQRFEKKWEGRMFYRNSKEVN